MASKFVVVILSISVVLSEAKIFDRCDLARTLDASGVPRSQIPTWVCIAKHESSYNTAAINRASKDHGIFQINQRWWCSPTNTPGKGCNITCDKLRDNDIKDDIACIKKIYSETKRLKGDGYKAWVAYKHCKNDNSPYIAGCF